MTLSRQRREQLKDPNRSWSRRKLSRAIQAGLIIRPELCMGCGKRNVLEGYHIDHSWPYAVLWFCRRCRSEWQKTHKNGSNGSHVDSVSNLG